MEWDFRANETPSWHAAGDVAAMRRTADGLVVVASGPAPTLTVSGLTIPAREIGFVRLRIRVSRPIDEAYLGWVAVDEGREIEASRRFKVPRELRGGFARSLWLRMDNMPDWSGTIKTLGVVLVVGEREQPVLIEGVALSSPGLAAGIQAQWNALGLDDAAEDRVFSLWAFNTVGAMRVGTGTLGGFSAWAVCAALVVVGLGRVALFRPSVSRGLVRAGLSVAMGVGVGLAVLNGYVEARAFRIERAVFGPRDVVEDRQYSDGFDLVGMTADIRRRYPAGTRMDVCYWGEPSMRTVLSHRLRYELVPLRLTPDAKLVVEFDRGNVTCHEESSRPFSYGEGYRVYER
jgi:hypothetical protein